MDGVLTIFDPLLGSTSTVVELHDVFRVFGEVGHDESYAREQLARVPLDLGNDAWRTLPRFGLVLEAVVEDLRLVGGTSHGTGQQMLDFPLQHGVGLDADGVPVAFLLQQAVQCRIGKRSIATKELGDVVATIPVNDWEQDPSPLFGVGLVATPEHGVLQIAELIEQKQWMVAGALKVAVVGRAFLLYVGLADGTVHVENQFL